MDTKLACLMGRVQRARTWPTMISPVIGSPCFSASRYIQEIRPKSLAAEAMIRQVKFTAQEDAQDGLVVQVINTAFLGKCASITPLQ